MVLAVVEYSGLHIYVTMEYVYIVLVYTYIIHHTCIYKFAQTNEIRTKQTLIYQPSNWT